VMNCGEISRLGENIPTVFKGPFWHVRGMRGKYEYSVLFH
jgi:hypothetical protein